MFDIRLLRQNLDDVRQKLSRRKGDIDFSGFCELETERKRLQTETQDLQARRNRLSAEVGRKKKNGEDAAAELADSTELAKAMEGKEERLSVVLTEVEEFVMSLPNIPSDDVPDGRSEADNVVVKVFDGIGCRSGGEDHVSIGERLGLMDFAAASKLSGARFSVLKGDLARLHRAVSQFMLDRHADINGYEELYVPYLVNDDSMRGTGQLPKFEEDLFRVEREGQAPLYLIPTAEVPVTNLVRDCILEEKDLPMKFVCHTPCFRSEAGAGGRDVRGMIRQHQFDKVELVQVVRPEESEARHEELTKNAEGILEALGLPYRRVLLCTGDMGFSSRKTFDLEVWLPSQETYREISSCSNFGDFQARRMKARYRRHDGKTEFVHTLNGSGLAVGRTVVAILENFVREDGMIVVPEVIRPYMNGKTLLEGV